MARIRKGLTALAGLGLALAVTAGRTYVIVVDGYNGRSGTFTLNVSPPP